MTCWKVLVGKTLFKDPFKDSLSKFKLNVKNKVVKLVSFTWNDYFIWLLDCCIIQMLSFKLLQNANKPNTTNSTTLVSFVILSVRFAPLKHEIHIKLSQKTRNYNKTLVKHITNTINIWYTKYSFVFIIINM